MEAMPALGATAAGTVLPALGAGAAGAGAGGLLSGIDPTLLQLGGAALGEGDRSHQGSKQYRSKKVFFHRGLHGVIGLRR